MHLCPRSVNTKQGRYWEGGNTFDTNATENKALLSNSKSTKQRRDPGTGSGKGSGIWEPGKSGLWPVNGTQIGLPRATPAAINATSGNGYVIRIVSNQSQHSLTLGCQSGPDKPDTLCQPRRAGASRSATGSRLASPPACRK